MTNLNDFLGVEFDANLSNSSEDDSYDKKQAKASHEIINKNVHSLADRKLKYDALCQKRTKIKEKYEKKAAYKLKKKNKLHLDHFNNNQASSSKTNELPLNSKSIKTLLQNGDSSFEESLEVKKIDLALEKNDIELAEELSDNLSTRLHEHNIKRTFESLEYQKKMDDKKLIKRKKPSWRFEPKQRWETKSNM